MKLLFGLRHANSQKKGQHFLMCIHSALFKMAFDEVLNLKSFGLVNVECYNFRLIRFRFDFLYQLILLTYYFCHDIIYL